MMKLMAALVLVLAVPAADHIDGVQGGQVRSPDRAWTISAPAIDAGDAAVSTVAWLRGPGVPQRRLMRFERAIDVIWTRGAPKVLLVERTTHFSRIRAFTLGPRERGAEERVEEDIEAALRGQAPRLGTIENRRMAFGSLGVVPCVLVEESGLPPGREAGSFVSRAHAFRIELRQGRAVPIPECPGASLD
ncbi:hypothetical protein [Sphingomonas sp.]|uniref:hypothetical protein n=1 Tax=Sphingomonas sp. TaxID=28214 RepID=UPI001B21330F|nr:hypothetical protein [Sphingomonas sp.]MBO9712889.1 hypothetical protein [Sphingomonas sp.]